MKSPGRASEGGQITEHNKPKFNIDTDSDSSGSSLNLESGMAMFKKMQDNAAPAEKKQAVEPVRHRGEQPPSENILDEQLFADISPSFKRNSAAPKSLKRVPEASTADRERMEAM